MIATLRQVKKTDDERSENQKFLAMLPSMRQQVRFAFKNCLQQENRDAIEEVVLLAFDMYVSLVRRGREQLAYLSASRTLSDCPISRTAYLLAAWRRGNRNLAKRQRSNAIGTDQ